MNNKLHPTKHNIMECLHVSLYLPNKQTTLLHEYTFENSAFLFTIFINVHRRLRHRIATPHIYRLLVVTNIMVIELKLVYGMQIIEMIKKLIEYLDMAWKIMTNISVVAMKVPVTPTYNAISFVLCSAGCDEAVNGKYVP